MNRRRFIAALALAPASALAAISKDDAAKVFGKIQFVSSFPNYKVQVGRACYQYHEVSAVSK